MKAPEHTANGAFPETRWTMIRAVQSGNAEEAADAMEGICRHYWFPIYAYLRRSGCSSHDAEDLTQSFFQKLIGEESIHQVRRERGKLRSFLLGVLRHHLSERRRDAAAQKRGGRVVQISFDEMQAEERYAHGPKDTLDPEQVFARTWAGELLAGVRENLRQTLAATGGSASFDRLEPYLMWDNDPPSYKEMAQQLGTSEGGARIMILRLRTKFRDMLREEVARTVLTDQEVSEELGWLQGVLAGAARC